MRDFFVFASEQDAGVFSALWWSELLVLWIAGVLVTVVDPFLRRREERIRRQAMQRKSRNRQKRKEYWRSN